MKRVVYGYHYKKQKREKERERWRREVEVEISQEEGSAQSNNAEKVVVGRENARQPSKQKGVRVREEGK